MIGTSLVLGWKMGLCKRQHKVYEKDGEWPCVFFVGLKKNLNEVKGKILGKKPLSSLREMFAKVRREEGWGKVMMGENNQPTLKFPP